MCLKKFVGGMECMMCLKKFVGDMECMMCLKKFVGGMELYDVSEEVCRRYGIV